MQPIRSWLTFEAMQASHEWHDHSSIATAARCNYNRVSLQQQCATQTKLMGTKAFVTVFATITALYMTTIQDIYAHTYLV